MREEERGGSRPAASRPVQHRLQAQQLTAKTTAAKELMTYFTCLRADLITWITFLSGWLVVALGALCLWVSTRVEAESLATSRHRAVFWLVM